MEFDNRKDWAVYRHSSITVLFILLVLSPLYSQPNPGGGGLFLPINNIVWIFASLFVGLVSGRVLAIGVIRWADYFAFFLCFIAVVVFSGFLVGVVNSTAWVFRVAALFGGFLYLLAFSQFRKHGGRDNKILLLIALSGFIFSVISLIGVVGSSATILFSQTNLLATALATSALVAIFLKDISDTFPRRRRWNLFLCAVVFLCSVVAFNLGSRVGVLSLIVGSVFMGVNFWWSGRRGTNFVLSVSLVLLAAIIVGVFGSGWDRAQDKFSRLEDGSDARIYLYSAAFRIAMDEPVLGSGFGSFERNVASMLSSDNQALADSSEPLYDFGESPLTHPHNEVLYWMAEAGVLGFVISVLFSLFLLFCLFSKSWKSGFSSLGMIFPITLHALVELPFYLSSWHWFVFLSILGLSLDLNRFRRVQLSKPFKVLCGLLIYPSLAGIILFHISTLRSLDLMSEYAQGGHVSPEGLTIPSRNYYLSEFVELMVVRHMFYEDVATGARSFFPVFIQVAESYLQTHANPVVYHDLSYAYYLLGRHNDCANLRREGLNIYPGHGGLLNRKCFGREEGPDSRWLRAN
jgi:O-antigen polymerase